MGSHLKKKKETIIIVPMIKKIKGIVQKSFTRLHIVQTDLHLLSVEPNFFFLDCFVHIIIVNGVQNFHTGKST